MIGIIPYAGTSFLTWDFLRAHFYPRRNDHSKRPSVLANLAIGAVSGAVSQTVSYLFEVIRRRMQVGGLTRPDRWLGWRVTIRTIYATSGFYIGLSIGCLKIIPMNGISFAVWQGCKWFFDLNGSWIHRTWIAYDTLYNFVYLYFVIMQHSNRCKLKQYEIRWSHCEWTSNNRDCFTGCLPFTMLYNNFGAISVAANRIKPDQTQNFVFPNSNELRTNEVGCWAQPITA